jgi:hypothetical protein
MRAATWVTDRDIAAARRSWERARTIADSLPTEDPNQAAMRIAPRTMLCGSAWRVQVSVAGDRFDELRELCTAAEDKASLAIGMAGLVFDHALGGRIREASRLASEAWALTELIGDPTLTVGLSFLLIYANGQAGEWHDALLWSERIIVLADGDPAKGNFIFGSPLAIAFASRGVARYCLGRPGWRDDLWHGLAMARSADPLSYAMVITYVYFPGIAFGVLAAHDQAVREIEDAVRIAERSSDDLALVLARATLGIALVHHQPDAESDHGQKLLAEASEAFLHRGQFLSELPFVNTSLALERARRGDRDEVMPLIDAAAGHLFREGRLLAWGYAIPATGALVETLLERGAEGDVAEAEAAIERLAAAPGDDGLAMREIWLLRLGALLNRARGNDVAYRGLVSRYRAMAESLGFEGHMAWAKAMVDGSG